MRKSILVALLLLVASLQTMYGQKVVVNKADGTYISYDVSTLNSIELYEVGTWLVRQIVLSDTHMCLKPDEMEALTASVIPEDADNQALTWESSNEEVAEVTKNGKVITNASGDCTIICSATDGSGVRATCEVHVMAAGTYGTTNGHDWVDLGLPSGTKWATCNVGAESPEEYGSYYAWGETEPKENYSWSTYKYNDEYDNVYMTKYSTHMYWGVVDNKTELEAMDDAATVNWGSNWQMPTKDQLIELIKSSYIERENARQNGVDGKLIISCSNGNSIFLPYAGMMLGLNLWFAVEGASFWSRSLIMSSTDREAYNRAVSSRVAVEARLNDCYYRYYGQSVRAVRKQ